jgi:bifunctional NMN adenylyltransferase/nudix hydrolase
MKHYDYTVFIGRFQPPHRGHLETIRQALEISDKIIIILGSANAAQNIKNPFTDAQRAHMLLAAFPDEQDRIIIEQVEDRTYQNKYWITDVQKRVSHAVDRQGWKAGPTSIALIGHKKDDSSWYLDSFPQWDFIETTSITIGEDDKNVMHSTDVRELFYKGMLGYIRHPLGADSTYEFMKDFMETEEYSNLKKEYEDGLDYERLFAPYPENWAINFFCADAVVVQSGHILLIKRAMTPGKGLWALPGGHVNANETSLEAAIRELKEESSLKVPEKVLRGCMTGSKFFDNPDRSLRGRVHSKRGRTVTMAYCFSLSDGHALPKVKGASDASETEGGAAWWFPISEFKNMRHMMFEDHYDIANYFIDSME